QVHLREFGGQALIPLGLPPALDGEAVDHQAGEVEEENSQAEFRFSTGGKLVFLVDQDRNQVGAIGRGGQRRPCECADGVEIDRRGDDGQVIDGVVAAFDGDCAGVIDQQGGEQDFDEHTVGRAAHRLPGHQPAFEPLGNGDGQQDKLFVRLVDGVGDGQPGQEQQEENVEPTEGSRLRVGGEYRVHAAQNNVTRVAGRS